MTAGLEQLRLAARVIGDLDLGTSVGSISGAHP